MSWLVLYVQDIMRILKSLLSKEIVHNRFTKEIREKINVKCSQLS